MSHIIENDLNLTTDAVPDLSPTINVESPVIEEDSDKPEEDSDKPEKEFISSSKCKSNYNNTQTSSNRTYKQKNKLKTPTYSTKVINVSGSTGIHIGNVNTYHLHSNISKKKCEMSSENEYNKSEFHEIFGNENPVTTQDINFIATHLGEGWRLIGEKLGYSRGEMDNFYADNKAISHKEVVYQMILDWTRMKPEESKVNILANALWESDQKDVLFSWSKTL